MMRPSEVSDLVEIGHDVAAVEVMVSRHDFVSESKVDGMAVVVGRDDYCILENWMQMPHHHQLHVVIMSSSSLPVMMMLKMIVVDGTSDDRLV